MEFLGWPSMSDFPLEETSFVDEKLLQARRDEWTTWDGSARSMKPQLWISWLCQHLQWDMQCWALKRLIPRLREISETNATWRRVRSKSEGFAFVWQTDYFHHVFSFKDQRHSKQSYQFERINCPKSNWKSDNWRALDTLRDETLIAMEKEPDQQFSQSVCCGFVWTRSNLKGRGEKLLKSEKGW